MVRRIAVLLALVFVLPASAHAADLSVDAGGVLHYTGSAGKTSNVRFSETGTETVTCLLYTSDAADE